MKTIFKIITSISLVLILISCENDDDSNPISPNKSYTITFWTDATTVGDISVWVDDVYKGEITRRYTSQPSCNSDGCVSITYSSPTTIRYRAESTNGTKWNNTINVTNQCFTYRLYSTSNVTKCNLMFWSNFSGPPIDVYIEDAYVGTIDKYYSTGEPDCFANGCVTVSYDSPRVISYKAIERQTGDYWNSTISVTSGCNKLLLRE